MSTPLFSFQDLKLSTRDIIVVLEDTLNTTSGPLPIPDPHAIEVPSNTLERHLIGHHLGYIPLNLHGNHSLMAHHCMFKEAHTISYIQQASHKSIEGNEEETVYAQTTENLRVVPTNIQHGPEVLQRFKTTHEPLAKALSSFENIESHGKPIKPVLR